MYNSCMLRDGNMICFTVPKVKVEQVIIYDNEQILHSFLFIYSVTWFVVVFNILLKHYFYKLQFYKFIYFHSILIQRQHDVH